MNGEQVAGGRKRTPSPVNLITARAEEPSTTCDTRAAPSSPNFAVGYEYSGLALRSHAERGDLPW
jgi:hypothetical protein